MATLCALCSCKDGCVTHITYAHINTIQYKRYLVYANYIDKNCPLSYYIDKNTEIKNVKMSVFTAEIN